MAVTVFSPAASADDWTLASDVGVVSNMSFITSQYNNLFVPALTGEAWWNLNTSSLNGQVVTAATFHFYVSSRTVTKNVVNLHTLEIEIGHILFVAAGTVTPTADGWHSVTFSPLAMSYISTSGPTRLRLTTADPGVSKWRTISIASVDSALNVAHLDVTHEDLVLTYASTQIIN